MMKRIFISLSSVWVGTVYKIFFGSSASWVGEKSLKASFYEPGLHLEYVWVDTEPLADVMCQPYVQPTPVNGLAGRMTGYHIALSM